MKRIWSHEHNAWWNPGWAGYTREFAKAGIYSDKEAEEIVTGANIHDAHNEIMVDSDISEPASIAFVVRNR